MPHTHESGIFVDAGHLPLSPSEHCPLFHKIEDGRVGLNHVLFLPPSHNRVASNNRVGGYARSDFEIEQIVDGLHEQEVRVSSSYYFSLDFPIGSLSFTRF